MEVTIYFRSPFVQTDHPYVTCYQVAIGDHEAVAVTTYTSVKLYTPIKRKLCDIYGLRYRSCVFTSDS